MNKVYQCEFCGQIFSNKDKCLEHEIAHLKSVDINEAYKHLIKYKESSICEYCENAYLVYGCELDCKYKKGYPSYCNNWSNFPEFKPKSELKEKWIKEYNLNGAL